MLNSFIAYIIISISRQFYKIKIKSDTNILNFIEKTNKKWYKYFKFYTYSI